MKLFAPVLCALMATVWMGCGSNPPASLEFAGISPDQPKIGEIATIRFLARDSRGEPMSGAQISFRLQNAAPGVTLNPTIASAGKGTGIAETQLVASSRVTSVVVVAEAEGTDGNKVAVSPPITFAGALPSAKGFTFGCGAFAGPGTGGIHGIIAYDNSRSLVPGIAVNCIAHVADRNGDGVGGAQVSFLSEAGTITPTTKSQDTLIGEAVALHKVSLPLPKNVDPVTFSWNPAVSTSQTGEYVAPLWMHPFDWITNPILNTGTPGAEPRRNDPVYELLSGQSRVNNPRDNLVTMIAVTTGEEGFDDVNNNGVYDNGEPFQDLTEPFVDSNDNGTWDPDERFIDTNSSAKWEGKNGLHDASTLIWVAERLLWTGLPNVPWDYQGAAPSVRVLAPVTQPVAISHFGGVPVSGIYSDPWFNPVARNADGDGCRAVGSDKVVYDEKFNAALGILTTYPSAIRFGGQLNDAHDPNVVPPAPAFPSPAPFEVEIVCTHTASPISPGVYTLTVATIIGTVL